MKDKRGRARRKVGMLDDIRTEKMESIQLKTLLASLVPLDCAIKYGRSEKRLG